MKQIKDFQITSKDETLKRRSKVSLIRCSKSIHSKFKRIDVMLWGKNLHICTSCRLPGPTPFLRSAVPSTSAADSAALSCLLFLVTDPETLSCCIYGVTSDLPVLRPLYAPAASREKRDQSVDARGRFIGRTVHTGRSRDASPQHRFGR